MRVDHPRDLVEVQLRENGVEDLDAGVYDEGAVDIRLLHSIGMHSNDGPELREVLGFYAWSRQESNLNPGLRRPLYYPLYYETESSTG